MSPSLKARLIQGAFICPTTDNVGFESLKNDEVARLDVAEWLESAGFQLNETAMGGAFFAGGRHINPAEHGISIRSQFKEAYEANAFVTLFLNLLRSARDASIEFKSGELLRSDEIYPSLSSSESHLARLNLLWNKLVKKNKDVSYHDKLIAAMDHLEDQGYLMSSDRKLGTYRICGKIEHLFDMIEYAVEHAPKNEEEQDITDETDTSDLGADVHG